MFAFGGTRTYHRLVCAIEDAGWEVRDCLQWIYGSGFPKSHNISKALDKAAGAEREVVGPRANVHSRGEYKCHDGYKRPWQNQAVDPSMLETAPATPAARTWEGWGTALKPAHEPICLAMKPLDGTFAHNALEHGVAGLNVDGGRVGTADSGTRAGGRRPSTHEGYQRPNATMYQDKTEWAMQPQGRWPANIIHDGSEEVLSGFPVTGASSASPRKCKPSDSIGTFKTHQRETRGHADNGGTAARFFYCAKASKAERNRGCEGLPLREGGLRSETSGQHITRRDGGDPQPVHNNHPTVKPIALMRYLCTLVTMPERNMILDPFAGSGTTGVACKELGLKCILMEKDERYCEIAAKRLSQEVLPLTTEPEAAHSQSLGELFANEG
jgi:site-specific DNA-methyltransferase (adenine-specific)